MFLDASDEVLLRRFSETRRRHPLSGDDLVDGVRRDRELMAELRHGAAVVDTSNLNMHQLKAIIQDRYGGTGKLAVTLVSFGFKHGLPLEFNLVFDVRFLPNPYFEPTLTHLDGRDPEVAKFVLGTDGLELTRQVESLLRFTLPHFQKEGKLYVTICVGCTGGRHRSVAIVEELRRRLGGRVGHPGPPSRRRTGDVMGADETRGRRRLRIQNELGLHARAATKLVQLASKFPCEVTVAKDGHEVNGKSIMGVLMLVAREGHDGHARARRATAAAEAVAAIVALIEDKFGEGK